MVPEGVFELIFYPRGRARQRFRDGEWRERPALCVGGLHDTGYEVWAGADTILFVTRFHAGAAHALIEEDRSSFGNAVPSFEGVFGRDGVLLEEQLLGCTSFAGRVRVMEDFLSKRMAGAARRADPCIEAAVARILDDSTSDLRVHDLAAELGVSDRQFRRRFKRHVGIGAKRFVQIARVQAFLRAARENPGLRLTDLTYRCGYFDQAHLSNSFVALTGRRPSEWGRYAFQSRLAGDPAFAQWPLPTSGRSPPS